nr:hypothetical protein [Tanacetum cinerariifolium]
METLTVESPFPIVNLPVPTACLNDSPEPSSEARLILKRVANQEETPSLDNILSLTNRFEDILGVTTSSDEIIRVEANKVWTLVDCPKGVRPIGTKWVLKNKKDERGIVVRNKARLVAQGRTQEEGIDYDEVFAPVARIKAIRLFLAYASFMSFTVYQMDVKSAFLYGTIDGEVYVMQPPRFQDLTFLAKVYKVEKAMYGLHQALRAWYVLQKEDGIFLSQDKYIGDILKKFGFSDVRSSNTSMDKENPWGKDGTGKDVELHLYISMIGSLMYLTTSRPDIMFAIYAWARHQVTPKECNLHAVKRIFRYFKGHPKLGLWYPKASPFDLVAFSYSDYGGASQDRKSTTRGSQFFGRRLISWQCKKQTIIATSTTEAEYVAAASCWGQVLWIQNQLLDYGLSMSCEDLSKEISISILSLLIPLMSKDDTTMMARCKTSWSFSSLRHCGLTIDARIHTAKTFDLVWIWLGGDYGNGEHNTDFHPMLDFLEASPLSNEPASLVRDVSEGEACPTDSGFIADQDRATIAKSSTLPHDSAPRVTSPAADEGSMQHNISELTALCTSLQMQYSEMQAKFQAQEEEIVKLKDRVKVLEDKEDVAATQYGDDAPIKGRSINKGEAAAKRIRRIDVPTGSGSILTACPPATIISTGSEVGPTASLIVIRRKGKEVMVESDTPKKKKLQEQIDAQDNYSKVYKFQSQHRRPMTKKQKREYYMVMIKSNLGWRFKDFKENEQVKKQKSSEEAPEIETSTEEITKEKMKEMMQLVPVEDIIRLGSSSACYQFFVDLLKQLDREDLNQLWALVKEYLSIRPATSDKDMELWVELKRLYEPDPEDQLQRDLYASRKRLSTQKRFSTSDDQLQALVKVVATARRLEMPRPEACTAIEEKKKKLPVKDRWHLCTQSIGPVDTPIQTRDKSKMMKKQSFIAIIHQKTDPALFLFCLFSCFLSQVEPKKVSDALQDPSWVEAMQEELLQFKIQQVWTLVDCLKGVKPIGTKWVLKNKKDERGIVIRNKARLMDVKSAFLYGTIDEEVYVMQPPGFQDPAFPAKVYKVEKAMYGLHQAPRAWQREEFILVQVYVDDIIFGSSNPQLCREYEALMHKKFQMSAMGKLNFFLGLQVLQKEDDIFLSQDKYIGDILKKFGFSDVRSSNTLMDKENPWGKDGTGRDVELHLYRSMIGYLMYFTASRLDIMFTVCACARHQVTPKECHLHAFPTSGKMVWVEGLSDDQLTAKMSMLHCMIMSHGGELLARYHGFLQYHHKVQCELLSLATSAGFKRGLSMHRTKHEFAAVLKKMSQFESTMTHALESLYLPANVVPSSFVIALEKNEEYVNVMVYGLKRISFGHTDVVMALFVCEKGDGSLLSSTANEKAAANPFGFLHALSTTLLFIGVACSEGEDHCVSSFGLMLNFSCFDFAFPYVFRIYGLGFVHGILLAAFSFLLLLVSSTDGNICTGIPSMMLVLPLPLERANETPPFFQCMSSVWCHGSSLMDHQLGERARGRSCFLFSVLLVLLTGTFALHVDDTVPPSTNLASFSSGLHSHRASLLVSIVIIPGLVGNLIIEWMVEPTTPRLLIMVLPIMTLYDERHFIIANFVSTVLFLPAFPIVTRRFIIPRGWYISPENLSAKLCVFLVLTGC